MFSNVIVYCAAALFVLVSPLVSQGSANCVHFILVNAGSNAVPTMVRGSVSVPGGITDSPGSGVTNGGFSAGLSGWTAVQLGGGAAPGSVSAVGGRAQFLEGDSFLVELNQTVIVPAGATTLRFDLLQVPGFDLSAQFVPDAFEAALLDANLQSVVPTWNALATSYFNMQETGAINAGPGVSVSGSLVSVDISAVPVGTQVTLYFDFIGADADTAGGVQIDNVRIQTPPHFDPPSPCGQTVSAQVGTAVALQFAASDLDPLDVVTLTIQGLPSWANFTPVAGNPALGILGGTPGFNQAGTYPLVLTATDQGGLSEQCSLTIQVDSNVPAFTAGPCAQTLSATVGQGLTFVVAASDPDVADILTLAATGIPAGATSSPILPAQGNPVSTQFSWTPAAGQSGTHTLTFTVTDLSGHTALCQVTIQVSGSPPVFSAPVCGGPVLPASVGVQIAVPILVTDPDAGDTVTLQASGVPAGAIFVPPLSQAGGNPAATEFRWTPPNSSANLTFNITITATDTQAHQTTCTFSIQPAECYLLIGGNQVSWPLGSPGDILLVDPFTAAWFPVTLQSIPIWNLPSGPAWHGLTLYSQVVMYNPLVFPWDPIRTSNGLRHVLGVGATAYGSNSGMSHWTMLAPSLGQPYTVQFAIAGF